MLVNQIAWQCQSLKASFKVSVFSLEDHSLLIQECSKMYLLEHQFLSNSWKTIFSWPNMFGKWCKLFFLLGGWQYTSTSKVLSSPTIKKFAIFCFTQHSPNLLAHQTLFSRTYKHQEEWMCWGAYVGKCCSKEMLKLAFFTAVQVSEVPAWPHEQMPLLMSLHHISLSQTPNHIPSLLFPWPSSPWVIS